MTATSVRRSATIPRLQELEFLGIAAQQVAAGNTYDGVRCTLIDFMAEQRERVAPSGYHAGHAGLPVAKRDPHRYMWNATESLAELMRLGFVEKAPLPTARKAAPLYQNRTFAMTEDGSRWVALLTESQVNAYEALLKALWVTHPQLSAFLRLVAKGTFVVPTANWGEAHPERVPAGEGREIYMRFLAQRAAEAVEAGVTGWQATREELLAALHEYIDARLATAERRRRIDPYPRSRDFVGACEEALVSFAFRRAGAPLDYISHEVVRRWSKTLGVASFSYHVPAAPALRLWATAEFDENDSDELLGVRRRTATDHGDHVIDELPAAYDLSRRRTPGNPWVPIYQVRAAVCSKLRISESVFDTAFVEHIQRHRKQDAPFAVALDPAQLGNTPPTERPLYAPDRGGRTRVFHVMTLMPRDRKESR